MSKPSTSLTLASLLTAASAAAAIAASPARVNAMPQGQAATASAAADGLDPARVRAIAALLPEKPAGPGRPISDRAFWEGGRDAYASAVTRAEGLLKQPLPAQPDDLYLEYSRNGNRTRWQGVANNRRGRVTALVLAECAENKGRFLPAVEELVAALCAEKTWVMPAHDAKLENFKGTTIDIDLGSSALGWNLAMADYLLGDRLSAKTRQAIRENVRRRILAPYADMVAGKRPRNWWMNTTNNWNSVCLAGVTGVALAQAESREERARFVAAAEKYSKNFLNGFTPDGYCSEGLGYWNYGFGNYAFLAETVRLATGGKLDLMAHPKARMPAAFGARIQIDNGLSPAFADCGVFAKPSAPLMYYVNRRLKLGLDGYDTLDPQAAQSTLFEAMLYAGVRAPDLPPVRTPAGGAASSSAVTSPLRTWFDGAGILIARPGPGAKRAQIAVALKGGNNAEHHNHNDLGSFVVALGDRPVLLDPGAETYTARTFSSRRYDSKLLNSYGHPVPVIGGTLQKAGADARAKVLKTAFTDDSDTLALDLTSAYPVPELKSLHRTFAYSRQGAGALTVTDRVEMRAPKSFGTALLTLGSWRNQEDGSLLVYDVDQAVRVEIDAGGLAYTLDAEEIKEDAGVTPTRIGINLREPVASAVITLRITPYTPGPREGGGTGLLKNGGFEVDSWAWNVPKAGMGSISTERAATGRASLKIADADSKSGSNILSARIPVGGHGGGKYLLRGKVYHASGSGIGMYVRSFDAKGERLNPADAGGGNEKPVGTLSGAVGKWEPFVLRFDAPPQTAFLQLWVHTFNASQVEAYLDDLEIVKEP